MNLPRNFPAVGLTRRVIHAAALSSFILAGAGLLLPRLSDGPGDSFVEATEPADAKSTMTPGAVSPPPRQPPAVRQVPAARPAAAADARDALPRSELDGPARRASKSRPRQRSVARAPAPASPPPATVKVGVRDALSGEAIPGASAGLYRGFLPKIQERFAEARRPREPVASGETDADGRVVLERPADRVFVLDVRAAGYVTARTDPLTAVPRVVWLHAETELEDARVTVRVFDPNGVPWAGAPLELAGKRFRRPDGTASEAPEPFRRGHTDSSGARVFDGLPAGRYDIRVPGAIRSGGLAARFPLQARFVEVREGSRREIVLAPAGGRATLRIRIVDTSGIPVPGVHVGVAAMASRGGGTSAITGHDGFALLGDRLLAGTYRVRIGKSPEWDTVGYHAVDGIRPPAADWNPGAEGWLVIEDGDDVSAEYVAGGAVIRGRLMSAPGARTISDVPVEVIGRRSTTVRTRRDGSFEIPGAVPGRYRLTAGRAGVLIGQPLEVVVGEWGDPKPVELRLVRPGKVALVVEGGNGAPVPQTRVAWLDAGGPLFLNEVFDGTRGHAFAPIEVPPGRHVFHVQAPGAATFQRTVEVASGQTVRVVVKP